LEGAVSKTATLENDGIPDRHHWCNGCIHGL